MTSHLHFLMFIISKCTVPTSFCQHLSLADLSAGELTPSSAGAVLCQRHTGLGYQYPSSFGPSWDKWRQCLVLVPRRFLGKIEHVVPNGRWPDNTHSSLAHSLPVTLPRALAMHPGITSQLNHLHLNPCPLLWNPSSGSWIVQLKIPGRSALITAESRASNNILVAQFHSFQNHALLLWWQECCWQLYVYIVKKKKFTWINLKI